MAASAGTMTLIGKSGRTYTIDVYVPDATGTNLTFNPSGLAASTSPDNLRVPEDCVIYDISIAAAPTAVGAILNVNSGSVIGGTIRHTNQLDSLPNRQKLNLPLKGGDIISWTQF